MKLNAVTHILCGAISTTHAQDLAQRIAYKLLNYIPQKSYACTVHVVHIHKIGKNRWMIQCDMD